MRLLKGAGADLDMANKNGWTAVYLAVAKKGESLEALRFLVSAGAYLDKADNDGCTPAGRAAQTNKPAVLRFLAEAGADLRKADKLGETPLDKAKMKGNSECEAIIEEAALKVGVRPLLLALSLSLSLAHVGAHHE